MVVEVDVSAGAQPKTLLVGLPEAAVKESTHRVERAIVNSGFQRPYDRVVINLAPAELPKQAASFDLPITLGLLVGSGQVHSERLTDYAAVGELSLEGRTRPVRGALSIAIAAARQRCLRGLVVPRESASEAAVVEDIDVIPVSSLAEAVAFYSGEVEGDPTPSRLVELYESLANYDEDFSDVRGQELVKRALTVASTGKHNLLMLGPPGCGETECMLRASADGPTVLPTRSSGRGLRGFCGLPGPMPLQRVRWMGSGRGTLLLWVASEGGQRCARFVQGRAWIQEPNGHNSYSGISMRCARQAALQGHEALSRTSV